MTNKEKIRLIEETLELEENTLTENTMLSEIENFDSMTKQIGRAHV